jgi:hypothetical protein
MAQQKSELDYFNRAAKQYYNGHYSAATSTVNQGLKVYPNNKKLIELKKCLGADPKAQEWIVYNKSKQAILTQGFTEGTGGSGYTSKTLTDPNGKKHVFVKKVTPIPPDGWTIFNNQEKQILNSGYQKGEGNAQDDKKELYDPNGNVHYYYKKKQIKIIAIESGFKEVSQNTMSWSKDLADKADKITIVFKTRNGAKESFDVTGKSRFIFESYNNQFHRVNCTVELIVELPETYKLNGLTKQEIWCLCSI